MSRSCGQNMMPNLSRGLAISTVRREVLLAADMNPSYIHGVANRPLIGQTIGDFLEQIAARFPANEALVSVFEKRRLTYAAFLEETNRLARALMVLGVQKGERIGVWSTNCVDWVLLQFATAKIGAVLVTINPAYRSYELEFALRQSECNLLVTGEGFKEADYARMMLELIPELKSHPAANPLDCKRFPCLRGIIHLGANEPPGMLTWKALFSRADKASTDGLAERQGELEFDDVINIQYTSGTTGFPKGAMLTHHNILNNGFWIGERMRLTERDRLCIPVPFYHCFGMVLGNLACITHGSTMVLPAPHFSPLHTLEAVALERCSGLHGVPTMFIAELDHPRFREFDLSSLRTGIMAGAPCPAEVMRRIVSDMHCSE